MTPSRKLAVLCFAIAASAVVSSQQPAAPAQTPQPIQPPRLLSRVAASYPPEAIRRRVQGLVQLTAIVEADGTVSNIEVARSLDPQLDAAAIESVRQWRYQPATLNGMPVRVKVAVNVAFNLDTPPAYAWPEGFAVPLDAGATQPVLIEEAVVVSGLDIRLPRPTNWQTRKEDPSLTEAIRVSNLTGTRDCRVGYPRPSATEIDKPLSLAGLQQWAIDVPKVAVIRGQQPVPPLAVGQVRTSDGQLWLWYETRLPLASIPSPVQQTVTGEGYESAHIWIFAGTVGRQFLTIGCMTMERRGVSDLQREAEAKDAATTFGAILRRLRITQQP